MHSSALLCSQLWTFLRLCLLKLLSRSESHDWQSFTAVIFRSYDWQFFTASDFSESYDWQFFTASDFPNHMTGSFSLPVIFRITWLAVFHCQWFFRIEAAAGFNFSDSLISISMTLVFAAEKSEDFCPAAGFNFSDLLLGTSMTLVAFGIPMIFQCKRSALLRPYARVSGAQTMWNDDDF